MNKTLRVLLVIFFVAAAIVILLYILGSSELSKQQTGISDQKPATRQNQANKNLFESKYFTLGLVEKIEGNKIRIKISKEFSKKDKDVVVEVVVGVPTKIFRATPEGINLTTLSSIKVGDILEVNAEQDPFTTESVAAKNIVIH